MARSGFMYRLCGRHEREWRVANADKHRRRAVDARLAAIALRTREPVEGRCWRCTQWEMATGRDRECPTCTVGLRVLAENERWRGTRAEMATGDERRRWRSTRSTPGGRKHDWKNGALFARQETDATSG